MECLKTVGKRVRLARAQVRESKADNRLKEPKIVRSGVRFKLQLHLEKGMLLGAGKKWSVWAVIINASDEEKLKRLIISSTRVSGSSALVHYQWNCSNKNVYTLWPSNLISRYPTWRNKLKYATQTTCLLNKNRQQSMGKWIQEGHIHAT